MSEGCECDFYMYLHQLIRYSWVNNIHSFSILCAVPSHPTLHTFPHSNFSTNKKKTHMPDNQQWSCMYVCGSITFFMSLLHRHSPCSSMLQAVYSITWAYVVWSSNRFPTMHNKNRAKWFLEPLSFISLCVGRFFPLFVRSFSIFLSFWFSYCFFFFLFFFSFLVVGLWMSAFSPSLFLSWIDRRWVDFSHCRWIYSWYDFDLCWYWRCLNYNRRWIDYYHYAMPRSFSILA